MIALVTFFCRREARILAHGPKLSAIHVGLYATGKRKLTWSFNLMIITGRFIQWPDLNAGIGMQLIITHHISFFASALSVVAT